MKRFLLYLCTYILITASVAFGTVTIDNLTTKGGTGGSSIIATEPQTPGDKLINKLMSMGGAELDVNVQLFDTSIQNTVVATNDGNETLQIPDIDISFKGNLNIANLDDIKMNGDIKLIVNGKEINLFVAFLQNKLYLSNETLNISLEVTSISKIMEIIPMLGLDMDLNIDTSTINIEAIMGSLKNIKEIKTQEGLKLELNVLDIVTFQIYCDNEYNVNKIEANQFALSNYLINLNANLNKNENIVIENPEQNSEKEFVDVTKTLNIVDSVKEIMTLKKLHLNLDAGIKNKNIDILGSVDVDFNNQILANANLSLNLDGAKHNLKIAYINSTIYIDFNGIRFKVDDDTLNETIKVLSKEFKLNSETENTLLELTDMLKKLDLKNGLKDINIDNLLEFSKGEANTINITIFGNAMGLKDDIKIAIVLDENDQFNSLKLGGLKLLGNEIFANIQYQKEVTFEEVDDSLYLNFNNLPNFVEATTLTVKDILNQKVVTLNLNSEINIKNTLVKLNGNVQINFNDNNNILVYGKLKLNSLNKTINVEITFENNTIYLTIDNLKFTAKSSEINELINEVKGTLQGSTIESLISGIQKTLQGTNVITKIINGELSAITSDLIKEMNITNEEAYIVISKNLIDSLSDIKFVVKFGSKINGIKISEIALQDLSIKLDVDLINEFEKPVINEAEFTSLKYAKNLILSSLNTVNTAVENKELNLKLNLSMKYNNQDINILGEALVKDKMVYANLNIPVKDKILNAKIYLENDTIYLNVDGLKVYTKLNEISRMVDLFAKDSKDLANIINEILPKFNFEQIKNMNFESLSFGIIKEILINETNSKIVLSKDFINSSTDIVIDLKYTNKLMGLSISQINMFNASVALDVDLDKVVEFVPFNKNDYGDISNIDKTVISTMNTINEMKTTNIMSFMLNLNVDINNNNYGIMGSFVIDFNEVVGLDGTVDHSKLKASFELSVLINNKIFYLDCYVQNGYLFAKVDGLAVKIKINSINDVINVITKLLPSENQVDINAIFNSKLENSILSDILNGNYNSITLDLIKYITTAQNSIYIAIDKKLLNSNNDVILTLDYQNDLVNSINISNANIKEIDVKTLNIQFEYNKQYNMVDESKYFEISDVDKLINSVVGTINDVKNNSELALNINELIVYANNSKYKANGSIFVNFKNAIVQNAEGKDEFNFAGLVAYFKLMIQEYDKNTNTYFEYSHNIEAHITNNYIYLTYNNLNVSVSVNSLKEVVDVVNNILNTQKTKATSNKIDVVKVVTELFPKFPIQDIMNGNFESLNLSMIKYLDISNGKLQLGLDKNILGTLNNIDLIVNYGQTISKVELIGLTYKNIGLDLNIDLLNEFVVPKIEVSKYSNLDNAPTFVKSLFATVDKFKTDKNIEFNLSTIINKVENTLDENNQIVKSTKHVITVFDTSSIKLDMTNAITTNENNEQVFNIENLKVYFNLDVKIDTVSYSYINGVIDEASKVTKSQNHKIELKFINRMVYIKFDKMSVKLSVEGINLAIDSICEIMGLNVSSNSFNNLVEIISNIMKDESILDRLKIEMIENISLTNNRFEILANIKDLQLIDGLEEINLEMNYDELGIKGIVVRNVNIPTLEIPAVSMNITNFTEILDYTEAEKATFIDLSTVGNLIEAFKNSINFTDFDVRGNVELKLNVIGIKQNFNVPVDAKIKLVNNDIEAKIVLGPIPVITGVNDDAPYEFGNTVSGGSPGKDRVLTIHIKDKMVYMHRRELVPVFGGSDKVYEKKLKIHMDTLLSDPINYILKYGLGLSDKIMGAIMGSIKTERTNPLDISNVLKDYTSNNNLYTLILNLAELTDNPQLQTFSLGVKTVNHEFNENGVAVTKPVLGGITLNMFMPVASGVEITINSSNLNLFNIGQICDLAESYNYINSYTYKEGASWDAYNGDWKLTNQRKFTITFVTNCDEQISPVEGIAGTNYALPKLRAFVKDDGITSTTYEFAGWYTTKTFDVGSEYTDNIIPRKNLTLYAKWNTISDKYVTISFVTNGGANKDSMKVLEGSIIKLPTYQDLLVINDGQNVITKQFDGWYKDPEFLNRATDIAPSIDTVLYAKWNVIDTTEALTLSIYDANEKILTKYLFQNDEIKLEGSTKFNATTKYYLDAEYKSEYLDMVMPNHNLDLHIRNEYTVKIYSSYGNKLDSTMKYYQGEEVLIPEQSSYYYDDGTQTERVVYTFNGYYYKGQKIADIKSFKMVNKDIEITADWTIEVKQYHEVRFDMSLNYIPKLCAAGCRYNKAPQNYSSIKILDGETLDLSSYQPTCEIKATAIGLTKYRYKATTWGTTKHADYSDGGDGFRSIVVNADTVLYPYWEMI